MEIILTNMNGREVIIGDVQTIDDFIDKFEAETGTLFNKIHLFSDDDCITSSSKTFEKSLENGKELLLIEEIKPVRILVKDVILNRIPRTLDDSKWKRHSIQ